MGVGYLGGFDGGKGPGKGASLGSTGAGGLTGGGGSYAGEEELVLPALLGLDAGVAGLIAYWWIRWWSR